MKSKLKEQWNSFISIMTEQGLTENQTKSLFLKIYLLHRFKILSSEYSDGRDRSIIDILDSKEVKFANFMSKFEIINVSKLPLHPDIYSNLTDVFDKLSDRELFSLLNGYDVKKIKGQYFTEAEIVSRIYKKILKENEMSREGLTIVDFSAGLGDFRTPVLESNYVFYSVELDPLSFEFNLFNVLWDPKISDMKKATTLLTAKCGDSLLAYQRKTVDDLFKTLSGKQLLISYLQNRLKFLNSQKIPSENEILSILKLREEITQNLPVLLNFNWFIDFPEIFFENDGSDKLNPGFDMVVGNPPWINYGSIDLYKYENLFSHQSFSTILYGKFNFSLPFVILAFHLSKSIGALVLPQGILTETYAHRWRNEVFSKNSIVGIDLLQQHWFSNVINEFCLVFWDKNKRLDSFILEDLRNKKKTEISNTSIQPPTFRLPLIPKNIYSKIGEIVASSSKVSDICNIRRGLTLTKKYQQNYQSKRKTDSIQTHYKKIIRHNKIDPNYPEGIFNFQVFHSGEEFVYDKESLGAPGDSFLFEQPKIIRRNRGKLWLIGLDLKGDYYVNDIFDLIYPNDNNIKIKTIFGIFTSSLVQYLAENYLQRDITSNFVRNLPFPKLQINEFIKIETLVDEWYFSRKTKEETETMRSKIDEIIFKHYNITEKTKATILKKAILHWK